MNWTDGGSQASSNVHQLWKGRFPARDVAFIESVLFVATGGDEVRIEQVEKTELTLEEVADSLQAKPSMALNGLGMPLWRWKFQLGGQQDVALYLVDAGRYRAFYYHKLAGQSLPLALR